MDYKIELQNNNRDLQSILNTINSLPDADSGSGTVVELPDAENFTFGTVTGAEYGITSENTFTLSRDQYTQWMSTYGYKFTVNEVFAFVGFRFMTGYNYSAKFILWDVETQTAIVTLTVNPTILGEWVEYRISDPINLEVGKTYMVTQFSQGRSYAPDIEPMTYCAKITVDGWYYVKGDGYPTNRNSSKYAIDILIQPPLTESVITEYKIQTETLTDIADELRRITGTAGSLSTTQIIDALEDVKLQSKTITPTEEQQVITPDEGYYGLSSVVVEAAENDGDGNSNIKPIFKSIVTDKIENHIVSVCGFTFDGILEDTTEE